MKVDLSGDTRLDGQNLVECIDCGISFTKKQPYHVRCSDCIVAYLRGNRDDEFDEDEETLPSVRFD